MKFLTASLIVLTLITFVSPNLSPAVAQPTMGLEAGRNRTGDPAQVDAEVRELVEEQILKSTVRIIIESWTVSEGETGFERELSTSHGTLMDGRYLVTHNHFGDLLEVGSEDGNGYKVVVLANTEGEPLLRVPLADFEVAFEGPETIVLAYREAGVLESLGFISADFAAAGIAGPEAGDEVAQVDWDGRHTRIDWTTVLAAADENGVPVLLLESDVRKGASGGGIFWQGMHVANNWRREPRFGEAGELIVNTMAALDDWEMLAESE